MTKRRKILLTLWLFGATAWAETPEPTPTPSPSPSPSSTQIPAMVSLHATLREKGTRKPLPNVSVFVFPAGYEKPLKAITDAAGDLSTEIPAGEFRWVVSTTGYERLEKRDQQAALTEAKPRTLYLRKVSYNIYETTVYGKEDNRDDKTKTLSQSQFLTMPGANGDPVKAVQNLPGVNRSPFLGSQVIIEGSAPKDTKYTLDTQEVPLIFHFAGLSSVVIPEAVDRVDYLSAGYGPEFGDSLSGLVNLYTRAPKTDRLHGMAFADLLNVGGIFEGPLSEHTSLMVGGRQSYIGAVLKAAASNSKDFNFTVAPDFRDLIGVFQADGTRDSFRFVSFGSQDSLAFVLSQPVKSDPSIRGTFTDETSFIRLIPEWVHKFDGGYVGRLWMAYGKDWYNINIGDNFLKVTDSIGSLRAEVEAPLLPAWKTYFGLEEVLTWSQVDFRLPKTSGSGGISNPASGGQIITESTPYYESQTGLYWRNIVHAENSKWTWIPGARLDYYNQTQEASVQPRAAVRYALDPSLTLRLAGGLYTQIPEPQELDPRYGNAALKSERAWHVSLGGEKDFGEGWSGSADGFYKYFDRLVIPSSTIQANGRPEFYNNRGTGDAYGLELVAKYQNPRWSGWLTYTLSRSTRISPPSGQALFAYDQTHALTALASFNFGKDWQLSARARFISGNPYTATIGSIFDADNDVYLPVRGALYSQRLEPFFQLDARVDKKWVFNTWILSAYLDVQNLTNRQNAQAINYSYDYSQTAITSGPPILPTLGVKGEF